MKQASKRKVETVHPTIREALGYDLNISDSEVYRDWEERKRRVCKPCWELHYCPYGPLVEQLPLLPIVKADGMRHNEYLQRCLESGFVGAVRKLSDGDRVRYQQWINDEDVLLQQAYHNLQDRERTEYAAQQANAEEQIQSLLGGPLPRPHVYRVKFDAVSDEIREEDLDPEVWKSLLDETDRVRKKYIVALAQGLIDDRKPLDATRRSFFESQVAEFDSQESPDQVPQTFAEASCTVFGHICPVYFTAESMTETGERRRQGRRKLKYETMIRIVRRDNYKCQHCRKHVDDREVEFDHIIPISKGGSSEEHNIRLTCFDCNRDKGDDYSP